MTTYTTQAQVRAAFWRDVESLRPSFPNIKREKVHEYMSRALDYNTDTRCAFVSFVDMLARNGDITDALARRVTL